jgi:cell division protein FtsZ
MSMHEINEAAEVITNAVAPDANIIFGATLKPELEDELIITVIATGFDSAYFRNKGTVAEPVAEPTPIVEEDVKDEDMNKFDMDLDDKKDEERESFTKEDSKPNNSIWHYDDEADTPAFLRRRKKEDE